MIATFAMCVQAPESSLIPCRPVVPVAPWIGGKRNLATRLIERIRQIPHRFYGEAFAGMGGVFLRRPFRAPSEAVNDLNGDVANLFRILQRHHVAFVEMLRWQLTTRGDFERLRRVDPSTLTDLERAARFLYLQRCAFGGKVTGQNFGVSVGNGARFDMGKLVPMLTDVYERLQGVVIERLSYQRFLAMYDRAYALFYLDPPYFENEDDYGQGLFGRDDFEQLAELLGNLKGRFILSLNDRAQIRHIFRRFEIETVATTYQISGRNTRAGELLITPAA